MTPSYQRREMSEKERRLETKWIDPKGNCHVGFRATSLIVMIVPAGLCYLIIMLLLPLAPVPPIVLETCFVFAVLSAAFVYMLGTLAVYRHEKRAAPIAKKRHREIADDFARGIVEAGRFYCQDVVGIREREDEGPKYCFRISEDKAVLLRGIHATECEHGDLGFPNTDIEIVRSVQLGLILKVACYGKPLVLSRWLQDECDRNTIRDGDIFDINWSRVLAGEVTF